MLGADEEDYLRSGNLTFLFALRSDGMPTGWVMMSEYGAGEVTMSTYKKSAKVRVLDARGAAHCVMVRKGDTGEIASALLVAGPVQTTVPHAGGPRARTTAERPADGVIDTPDEIVELVTSREASGKRVIIRLRPDRCRWLRREDSKRA
jgi:hypothetical protein